MPCSGPSFPGPVSTGFLCVVDSVDQMDLLEPWFWNSVKEEKAWKKRPSSFCWERWWQRQSKWFWSWHFPPPAAGCLVVKGAATTLVPKYEALFLEALPRICLLGSLSDSVSHFLSWNKCPLLTLPQWFLSSTTCTKPFCSCGSPSPVGMIRQRLGAQASTFIGCGG